MAAAAAIWCMPAAAEWSLSFPAVATCTESRSELPPRWRAAGLMMPFHQGQVDVGEFVYDGELPAMRASVYGLESGAADILITDTETYLLIGPHDAPTGCRTLGR